jgi:5-hydroxyisourate hydrolase
MGKLTTHVLDTAHGCPGRGVSVELFRLDQGRQTLLAQGVTNQDGRCDKPLLEGAELLQAEYQLLFHAGAYFKARGVILPEPCFVDIVVLRFGIASPEDHYHIPLLVSPWSYSTYRGC